MPVAPLVVAALAAVVAGVMNSIAGGGTLLTFPALIAAGLSPLTANATSTVALLPAALSSMLGYRGELRGARRWAVALAVPSLAGGGFGAFLLLHTSNLYYHQYQGRLAKRLCVASGMQRVFFANSGTEAMEGALKMVRSHGRRMSPDRISSVPRTS